MTNMRTTITKISEQKLVDVIDDLLPMCAPKELINPPIRIAEYPQLKAIAWNRRDDSTIGEEEALALYERNWRYVDVAALEPKERLFIDRLIQTIGKGVFFV